MTAPHQMPDSTLTLLVLLVAALVGFGAACTPSHLPAPDGSDMDVLADAGDAGSEVDAGMCTDEGYYYCAGMTHQCCRGMWVEFYDGPCWRRDGGVPDCTAYPGALGCPCAPDHAGTCPAGVTVLGARHDCVGGVWTWSPNYACCN